MKEIPAWITELEQEELNFIKNFVLSSGSLKEMAGIYKVTYPTVRIRLDQVIKKVRLAEENKEDPYVKLIKKLALEEKIDFVENYAKEHGTFSFKKMLEGQRSKMEIVVVFLAILELMKMGKIVIKQEDTFADIIITSAKYYRKEV